MFGLQTDFYQIELSRVRVDVEFQSLMQLWRHGLKLTDAPTPITNYALFHDGEYVTNEQMNDKKFLKLTGK